MVSMAGNVSTPVTLPVEHHTQTFGRPLHGQTLPTGQKLSAPLEADSELS